MPVEGWDVPPGYYADDPPPEIPGGVYWSREAGNFYDERTNTGMGWEFYAEWQERKNEFPEKPTTTPGIDLHYNKPVRIIG